jgi:serine/threonine protein kinase
MIWGIFSKFIFFQLAALLCEVKILANLDHHLNLVNLMGACTSELHNGELLLLLEFCSHGDLKVINAALLFPKSKPELIYTSLPILVTLKNHLLP